ncbi:hypothetical protein HK100_004264 [Physocladia obscura]|uniref:Uncharacterized protein n=1 Tax=Physocladia obscura TaxID=109957 RepID=A0AAD5ST29_9FUNG|nr:hypothetical protein HK100_004264 [Physocladia obscura]
MKRQSDLSERGLTSKSESERTSESAPPPGSATKRAKQHPHSQPTLTATIAVRPKKNSLAELREKHRRERLQQSSSPAVPSVGASAGAASDFSQLAPTTTTTTIKTAIASSLLSASLSRTSKSTPLIAISQPFASAASLPSPLCSSSSSFVSSTPPKPTSAINFLSATQPKQQKSSKIPPIQNSEMKAPFKASNLSNQNTPNNPFEALSQITLMENSSIRFASAIARENSSGSDNYYDNDDDDDHDYDDDINGEYVGLDPDVYDRGDDERMSDLDDFHDQSRIDFELATAESAIAKSYFISKPLISDRQKQISANSLNRPTISQQFAGSAMKTRLFSALVGNKRNPNNFNEKVILVKNPTISTTVESVLPPKSSVSIDESLSAASSSNIIQKLQEDHKTDDYNTFPELPESSQDYSIKTTTVIICSNFQSWLKNRSESEKYMTLHDYINKKPLDSLSLRAKFDHNLISFVYPNGPKTPTHVGVMARVLAIKPGTEMKPFELRELAHFTSKEQEWRQSFRSLFSSFNLGVAEYFYYMNSEFAVLFQQQCGNFFRAFLSKASTGLARKLSAAGIQFTRVIAPTKVKNSSMTHNNANETEKSDARNELKELEKIQPGRTVSNNDASNMTTTFGLIFTGIETLTALHEFLIYWVEQSVEKRALHQPVLISPSPFLNASMKAAEVSAPCPYSN